MSHAPGRLALVLLLVAAPAFGAAATRRAFVTETLGTGKLADWPNNLDGTVSGGLAKANKICENSALGVPLGNETAFRAWISTSSTSAYCNLLGLTGQPPNCNQGSPPSPNVGPWRMANGATFFANSLGELVSSSPEIWHPLSRDQNFVELTNFETSFYWTGTTILGASYGSDCSNWEDDSILGEGGRVGTAHGTSIYWTSYATRTCDKTARLLCLEAGEGLPLELDWTPGSIVFVTSTTYFGEPGLSGDAQGQSGTAAGDAICETRAKAARLPSPESFVAWLGDETSSPDERITSPGPFRRLDGIAVSLTKAGLLDDGIDSSIHQMENGLYVFSAPRVWTGVDGSGQATGFDCDDWGLDNSISGTVGSAGLARTARWTDETDETCSESRRLYCFSNAITLFWDGFESTGDTSRWSLTAP